MGSAGGSKAHSIPYLTSCVSSQEAVSTGVIRLLGQDDYVCSTYRDHVHALSKNVPAREIMAELFGKKTGICRGQGGSMHMFSKKHGLVSIHSFTLLGLPGLPSTTTASDRDDTFRIESVLSPELSHLTNRSWSDRTAPT